MFLLIVFSACQKAEISENTVTVPDSSSGADTAEVDPELKSIQSEFDSKIKEMNSISFDELENAPGTVSKMANKNKIVSNQSKEAQKYRSIADPKTAKSPKAKEALAGSLLVAGERFEIQDVAILSDPEEGFIKINFYQQKLAAEDKYPGMPLPLNFAISFKFNYRQSAFCQETGMLSWQARLIIPKRGYSGDFKGSFLNNKPNSSKINLKCSKGSSGKLEIQLADGGQIRSAGKVLDVRWQLLAEVPWQGS